MKDEIALLYPRQTILVTTELEGKDNIITLDWHMPVSVKPLLYAICIGKKKFSRKLIDDSGVFAVNFVPYKLKDAAIFCGRNSGEHIDKFEKTVCDKPVKQLNSDPFGGYGGPNPDGRNKIKPLEQKARAMLYAAKWGSCAEGERNNAAYAHA